MAMDLDDVDEFREWLRSALTHLCPLDRTIQLLNGDTRDVSDLRRELAETGILGALIAESEGGLALSPELIGVTIEETGRSLLPIGFLASSVLCAALLRDVNGAEDLRRTLASGESTFAWVDVRESDQWSFEAGALSHSPVNAIDADIATHILVSVADADAVRVFVVDPHSAGVHIDRTEPLDRSLTFPAVTMMGAPARELLTTELASAVDAGRTLVMFGLGFAAAGAAQAMAEMTTEYAMIREQFGRPIGGFQAVKHMCADMFVAGEASSSAMELTARRWGEDGSLGWFETLSASSFAISAAKTNAQDMMQIHAGIAFTWEHPAHWYLKRATAVHLMSLDRGFDAVAGAVMEDDFDLVARLIG